MTKTSHDITTINLLHIFCSYHIVTLLLGFKVATTQNKFNYKNQIYVLAFNLTFCRPDSNTREKPVLRNMETPMLV